MPVTREELEARRRVVRLSDDETVCSVDLTGLDLYGGFHFDGQKAPGPFTGARDEWFYPGETPREAAERWRTDRPTAAVAGAFAAVERDLAPWVEELPQPRSFRRRRRIADEGDSVDVDSYLARRPECWETYKRVGRVPSVTLGWQINQSGGNDTQSYAETAAAAVLVAELLRARGCRVRIVQYSYGICSCRGPQGVRRKCTYREAVGYGQPIDSNRLLAQGDQASSRAVWFVAEIGAYTTLSGGEFRFANEKRLFDRHFSSTFINTTPTAPSAEALRFLGVDVSVGRVWESNRQTKPGALFRVIDEALRVA